MKSKHNIKEYTMAWGATDVPFGENAGKAFFLTDQYDRASQLLQQTAALRSVMLLSGPNGIGKSQLLSYWSKSLDPKRFAPVVITQATLNASGMLSTLLSKLGREPSNRRSNNLEALEQVLHNFGTVIPVLILDEAQLYAPDVLEEVRLTLGLNLPDAPTFALILCGDDYILATMRYQSRRALYTRISVSYQLKPLDRQEAGEYLLNRMKAAGIDRDPFDPAASDILIAAADGIPRAINLIGRMAWLEASRAGKTSISADHVADAINLIPSAHDKIATQV